MCASKSKMSTLGKLPQIISLVDDDDDDIIVSGGQIELVTIDESFCCQTPSYRRQHEGVKTPTSVDKPTVSRDQGEDAVNLQSNASKALQRKLPDEDDQVVYSFSSLDMERLRDHMCQAQPAKDKGIGPGKAHSEKQADVVRQPLGKLDAKNNPKRVAKRKKTKGSNGPEFLISGFNSNERTNGPTTSQKHLKKGIREEENSNKGNVKTAIKKKGKKRKADAATIVHKDEMPPLKSIKLAADSWQPTPNSSTKPMVKSKTKKKKKKQQRQSCETNTGKPVTIGDSSDVQVHVLSSTNEFVTQVAPDSDIAFGVDSVPCTPLQNDLKEKNAPLGSHINPITIADLSFAHENERAFQASNEKAFQASNEKACSENQKQVEVSSPEIEILCVVMPSSASNPQSRLLDVASRQSLPENNGKKATDTDIRLTPETGTKLACMTQMKSRSEPPHRFTANLHEKQANKHVPTSALPPAGPCFGQPNLQFPFTFTLQNNLHGIGRTIYNDVMTGSERTLIPATNSTNWPPMPLLRPDTTVIQWTNLLAEQAELHHRANRYNDCNGLPQQNNLRPIAIDGSNVAFSHGKDQVFSTKGIKICIDYFLKRGHVVKAFVPQFRRKAGYSVQDQPILEKLGKSQHIVFTPSRDINGVNVACYDDRFVLEYAARTGAVIVSNDNYRDLMKENPLWKEIVNSRLLMYSFADDHFMVPEDPLGRHGPRLHQFLRF